MADELLPCPYCGGEDIDLALYYDFYRFHCSDPDCYAHMTESQIYMGVGIWYGTVGQARDAWNARADTVTVTGITTVTDTPQITYVPERTCRIVKTCSDSDYVDGWNYRCSECRGSIPVYERDPETGDVISAANYCPNCGARVIGVGE